VRWMATVSVSGGRAVAQTVKVWLRMDDTIVDDNKKRLFRAMVGVGGIRGPLFAVLGDFLITSPRFDTVLRLNALQLHETIV